MTAGLVVAWNVAQQRWVVETAGGEFVGDCGLTMQVVEGHQDVEIGYHVRAELQGRGFASEAAMACRDYATSLGVTRLIAIIAAENGPSRRVAITLGLSLERTADVHGAQQLIYSTRLPVLTKE